MNPYSQDGEQTHPAAEHGKEANSAPGLRLQTRRLGLKRDQRLADLADLASCSCRRYFCQS
jgi:hypothetical protein